MLHAKSIENLPHQIPPVNHSDFPNKITHRQMILGEGHFYVSRELCEMYRDVLLSQKREKKIEKVINKNIKTNYMTPEEKNQLEQMQKAMRKKKDLRELIFKYKDHALFKDSNNLKRFYYNYLLRKKDEERKQRQLEEQERLKKREDMDN